MRKRIPAGPGARGGGGPGRPGVIALGRLATEALREQGRYLLSFTDIDCTPPEGLSRQDFLDESGSWRSSPTS